jgi:serine/threonine-protein kinase
MSTRLARIEELFHAVLEQPTERRADFLVGAEPDAQLRAEVERLLARHTDDDALLRAALVAAVGATALPREHIGAYRLVRELGAGGMGTVFLAERHLGDTVQQVALKLVRGFPTRELRERMARERDFLAGLNHPNIARLIDGGDSEDGQPYLVMDYVDGVPLLDYCAQHALDLRARLALFLPLCSAVQHAHQRLIVHRDIKPANIFVRADGMPVLLDFGIGKLLDATSTDETATRVFTPAYAAPEQREGRHATTASDVYGLGCVLFELLGGGSVAEQRHGDEPLPRPSSTAADAQQARRLRGDLDQIVLKATHAEPARRYASADALARDIESQLAGRPVSATPDSVAYRARKYLARHRYGTAAVVLAILLASGFVWRLAVERAHALEQAHRAEATRDFLVSLFRFADPGVNRGKPPSVRELLDQGRAQLESGLKDEPTLRAELFAALAKIYANLADYPSARDLIDRALADQGSDARRRAEWLGERASIDFRDGNNADALAAIERALAELPSTPAANTVELRLGLLDTRAAAQKSLGRAADSAATMREVLALLPQAGAAEPEHRAFALDNLAHVEEAQGHYPDALRYAADAEAAFIALRGADHPEPLAVGAYRAGLLAATRDLAGAEAKYREVLAAQRKLFVDDNDRRLSNTETYLARVLLRQDRAAEAAPLVAQAQARCERTAGADHAQCPLTRQLWGETEVVLGHADAGIGALREAVALREADKNLDARSRQLAHLALARGLCLGGAPDEGRREFAPLSAPLLALAVTSPLDRTYIARIARECNAPL